MSKGAGSKRILNLLSKEKMNLKKLGIFVSILVLISAVIIYKRYVISHAAKDIVIGIIQTASHPALDAARDGFIETLTQKMGNNVEFVIQNAQGSPMQAHTIAQQFHTNQHIKAIYAIATPAAQAISAVEKEKPIIVAAMTDTAVLGEQQNICGVTDMIDMHKEIEMMHQLLPHLQTVAILYSTAEVNAVMQVQQIKKELQAFGISAEEIGITQESDIPSAVDLACRKADALLCTTDNMLASAMELVVNIANRYNKPLFACHNQAVAQGALAARGVDYIENGRQAAECAYAVLVEGKKPHELPIAKARTDAIYINKKRLDALGLKIPEDLKPVIFV